MPRKINRKEFFLTSAIGGVVLLAPKLSSAIHQTDFSTVHPKALKRGDLIAITAPAGAVFDQDEIVQFSSMWIALGYEVLLGDTLYKQEGYLAGNDRVRAHELMSFFKNKKVKAIIAMRGGWGSSRILEYLDFDIIRNNPKILMGFSDITSLLLAIYDKTGMITFHGPVGYSNWEEDLPYYFDNLFLSNSKNLNVRKTSDFKTLIPGKVEGKIVGGNLTVLCHLCGSNYLPNMKGKILFVEETGEEAYRIDRLLMQLKLSGILDQISGFIFSNCRKCDPEFPNRALSFEQVVNHHIKPLGVPACIGLNIGHLSNQAIIPIGAEVEFDALDGDIKLINTSLI